MTLSQILPRAALAINQAASSPNSRAILLEYINLAAEDFWTRTDLPDSLAEETGVIISGRILAMPEYVGEIRAIRDCYDKATIFSRAARYQSGNWARSNCRNFVAREKSALKRSPANLSSITVTLAEADVNSIKVWISGQTPASASRTYEFSLPAGTTTVTLSTSLIDVATIIKDKMTTSNVVITDADNLEISLIPNNATDARFIIIEVGQRVDGACCSADSAATWCGRKFDLLYKKPFARMVNDTDVFPIDGHDSEFFFAMMEYKRTIEMPNDVSAIPIIVDKQRRLRLDAEGNEDNAKLQKIDTGVNPFIGAFRGNWSADPDYRGRRWDR